MNFSLWNFKEWFDCLGIDLSYRITDNTPSISMLSFSPAEEKESAWILPGYQLNDSSGFNSVLIHGNDRILFPVASTIEVNNQGNRMIRHYTKWENSLMECIMQDGSLSDLFTLIQKEFPFPFVLMLPGGSIHSKSKDCKQSLKEKNRQQILQAALNAPGNTPVCRTFMFDPTRSFLFGSIMNGTKPIAVLTAYEENHRFQPGHITLFYFIREIIQTYLDFHTEVTPATHPLSRWFQQTIEAEEKALQLPQELTELNWKEDDCYQIMAIGLQADRPPVELSDLYYRYASLSVCCAVHQNTLFVLSHYEKILPANNELRYSSPAATSNICCGLSLPFHGLTRMQYYLKQAQVVLSLAQTSGKHLLRMEDQLVGHLLRQCQNIPEARSMIHPDILALEREDRQNNEHLIQTLYAYFVQGQSSAQTSKVLFIHRNTLRNRLDRIQRFLTFKLDTEEARDQYLISLILCNSEHMAM
ncbi:MAG: helix-turn-helix domain-containing protein [Lachnospiraceae bacterium]|nr:helix-turn-helix domain-containing protein [Lachnospiraceae bacterium]